MPSMSIISAILIRFSATAASTPTKNAIIGFIGFEYDHVNERKSAQVLAIKFPMPKNVFKDALIDFYLPFAPFRSGNLFPTRSSSGFHLHKESLREHSLPTHRIK